LLTNSEGLIDKVYKPLNQKLYSENNCPQQNS